MEGAAENALTDIGEATSKSCKRCQRRKVKCDRRQPCSRCHKANVECHRSGSGEKQRPVQRSYVQALEGQIASLELFIHKLAAADIRDRDTMLSELKLDSTGSIVPMTSMPPDISPDGNSAQAKLAFARARTGKMYKSRGGNSSQFYGPTSLFQVQMSSAVAEALTADHSSAPDANIQTVDLPSEEETELIARFPYAPHDELPQSLMSTFFQEWYPYNMFIYREFFLRDYDTGSGPYYSELLFYAICAAGALASEDSLRRSLWATLSDQAQVLLYGSLDKPTLTTLQALILLGHLEIGHGRPSKGWLLCGMAFRLAHEMGLHLDPNNWKGSKDSQMEMEIRRRVYWAAFSADKELSIYFGRPPALYPHESDVRNTIRIPYPAGWEELLDTYISKGTSSTAYEDGIALSGSFIYRVELNKIRHTMMTELFENRRKQADGAYLVNTVRQIHTALTKWLSDLPGKLHWNQWTIGQVPAYTLHLHMVFHTTMIVLHRPPRSLLQAARESTIEDVEICIESLRGLLKLMKTYSRYYSFRNLPLDFVHTLSTAAGVILMQKDLGDRLEENDTAKSLEAVLSAMDGIKESWPCVTELRTSFLKELQSSPDSGQHPELVDNGLMASALDPCAELGADITLPYHDSQEDYLGPLLTDDFLIGQFSWDDITME